MARQVSENRDMKSCKTTVVFIFDKWFSRPRKDLDRKIFNDFEFQAIREFFETRESNVTQQVKSLCFSENKFRFQLRTNNSGRISIHPPCHEEGQFYSLEEQGLSQSAKIIIAVFTSIFGLLLILCLIISDRFSQYTPNATRIIQAFVKEGM